MKNGIILGDGKGNLLMSNEDGIFESHDNGETWEKRAAEKMEFAPVVHAEWKFNGCGNEWYGPSFTCSLCGDEIATFSIDLQIRKSRYQSKFSFTQEYNRCWCYLRELENILYRKQKETDEE